jgi:peptide-methionine (R)-S-oxide reductase
MSKLLILLLTIAAVATYASAEEEAKPAASAKEESATDAKDATDTAGKGKLTKQERAKAEAAALKKQIAENPDKVDWSKVDWRAHLSRMQYHIMREAGTEAPFKNKFWNFFKDGQYRCAGCGLPLFESDAKFDSDCGWPSFDKTIAKNAITEHTDYKIGYPRTEIRCRRCQAHLGHVFNDGPTNTGLRYCLNSAAMQFKAAKQLEPDKKPANEDPKPETKAPAAEVPTEAAPAEK